MAITSLSSKLLSKSSSHEKDSSSHSSHSNSITDVSGSDPSTTDSVEDIDEVDDQGQSILMSMISQLRPGSDLSRITFPTFILERKSMLERVTNLLQQPDILIQANNELDPIKRFLLIVKWYNSCWHIAPKAVKKPLNPILGEYFTCYWDLPNNNNTNNTTGNTTDNTTNINRAYYIAEQTSHHPPKSSYFYTIPSQNLRIDGIIIPKSRFLGNSTAAIMDGVTKLTLFNHLDKNGKPEVYTLTQPNMYARGILFGKLKFELGDHLIINCNSLNLNCDIEFKTKGFISGTYNAIDGLIKNTKTNENLYQITGKWNEIMELKDLSKNSKKTGSNKVTEFFNCFKAKPLKPIVRKIDEQGEFESRKLWLKVTDGLAKRDHKIATDEKYKIEENQRKSAKKREEEGVEFHPKLFKQLSIDEISNEPDSNLEYLIYKDHFINKDLINKNNNNLINHIFEVAPILPGQHFNPEFEIPAYQKLKKELSKDSDDINNLNKKINSIDLNDDNKDDDDDEEDDDDDEFDDAEEQ